MTAALMLENATNQAASLLLVHSAQVCRAVPEQGGAKQWQMGRVDLHLLVYRIKSSRESTQPCGNNNLSDLLTEFCW